MRDVQPKGSLNIIGHSFGSVVAYEVCAQLEDKGEKHSAVLLDTHATVLSGLASIATGSEAVFVNTIKDLLNNRSSAYINNDSFNQIASMTDLLNFIDNSHCPLEPVLIRQSYQVFKKIAEIDYTPHSLLLSRLYIIKASDGYYKNNKNEPHLGWDSYTQNITNDISDGDHISMLSRVNVTKGLTEKISHFFC